MSHWHCQWWLLLRVPMSHDYWTLKAIDWLTRKSCWSPLTKSILQSLPSITSFPVLPLGVIHKLLHVNSSELLQPPYCVYSEEEKRFAWRHLRNAPKESKENACQFESVTQYIYIFSAGDEITRREIWHVDYIYKQSFISFGCLLLIFHHSLTTQVFLWTATRLAS